MLTAERTFWEKATLIHSECNRPEVKKGMARMSRHWYDLAQLATNRIGDSAIEDKALLEDVVRQKNVLYYAGYSNYDECLTGGMKLVPEGELAEALHEVFERMRDEGMFWQAPGAFADLVTQLEEIEGKINKKFG